MSLAAVQRAELLLQQSRFTDAERELRQALSDDPRNAIAHAMLARALSNQQRLHDAEAEARAAVGLEPDEPYVHMVLAEVLQDRRRFAEARRAIDQAIQLDPFEPDSFAILASIHASQEAWRPCLEAADKGLSLDPEHPGCINLRAIALTHLGRREEAAAVVDGALANDPLNAMTHANQGWTYLHRNDPHKALEHFREAMRLDPINEWARAGIVEAMKARNIIYRALLAYFLWMARMSGGARMGIIIGGWIGYQILRGVARQNPELGPLLWPLLIAYLVFVWMTWLSVPLFNALLRLDRYGRYALSREQTITSNWILGLLTVVIVSIVIALVTPYDEVALLAMVALLLTIPVSTIWRCEPGWPRIANIAIALGLAGLGLGGVLLEMTSGATEFSARLLGMFLIGTLIASFAVQSLASATPAR